MAIASKDLGYVARSFIVTLAFTFMYMSACRHYGWSFVGIWTGIVGFFMVRSLQSGLRVLNRHLRMPPQPPAAEQTPQPQPQ